MADPDISSATPQQLVDMYAANAPDTGGDFDLACTAAYELEQRGFVEIDGTWQHRSKAALAPFPSAVDDIA